MELPALISDFPIFVVASHIVIASPVELIKSQARLGCRAMRAEHKVVESICPMWLDCEGLCRVGIQDDVISIDQHASPV